MCEFFKDDKDNNNDIMQLLYVSYFVNSNYSAGWFFSDQSNLLAKYYPTLITKRICNNDYSILVTQTFFKEIFEAPRSSFKALISLMGIYKKIMIYYFRPEVNLDPTDIVYLSNTTSKNLIFRQRYSHDNNGKGRSPMVVHK